MTKAGIKLLTLGKERHTYDTAFSAKIPWGVRGRRAASRRLRIQPHTCGGVGAGAPLHDRSHPQGMRRRAAHAACRQRAVRRRKPLHSIRPPMQERIPAFVSETEHYKRTPQQVREYIRRLYIRLTEKPCLNFVRMDRLDTLDGMEGVLFFATPDILSGLCSWAFYDNDADDAVAARFASGCCSIVTFAMRQNRPDRNHPGGTRYPPDRPRGSSWK